MLYEQEKLAETIRSFLEEDPYIGRIFEKNGKQMEKGFMYVYEREGHNYLFELTLDHFLPILKIRSECNIYVDAAAFNNVVQACQLFSPPDEPGVLVASMDDHHYMRYELVTPAAEPPVTRETLTWMHTCAYEQQVRWGETLRMLAVGRIDPLLPELPKRKEPDPPEFPRETLALSRLLLAEEFSEAPYNVVGVNRDEEDSVFSLIQILTEDGVYYEKIAADRSGCLLVSIRPARSFDRAEQAALAPICNQMNDELRFNGLHAFSDDGFLWFCVPVSLWGEMVGIGTLKTIEPVAMNCIRECLDRWRKQAEPKPDEHLDTEDDGEGFLKLGHLFDDDEFQRLITFGAEDPELDEDEDEDEDEEVEPVAIDTAPRLVRVPGTSWWVSEDMAFEVDPPVPDSREEPESLFRVEGLVEKHKDVQKLQEDFRAAMKAWRRERTEALNAPGGEKRRKPEVE